MHVDGKRSIEAATSTSTSNSVFHLADEYEKQFRSEVDDLDLSRVVKRETKIMGVFQQQWHTHTHSHSLSFSFLFSVYNIVLLDLKYDWSVS